MSQDVMQHERLPYVDGGLGVSLQAIIRRRATVSDDLTEIGPRMLDGVDLSTSQLGPVFTMRTRAQLLALIESLQAAYEATADTPDEDEEF